MTGKVTAVATAMITGAPSPRLRTEVRSPRSAAAPTPKNSTGTDSQATTLSIARHGPLNHDAKFGVVVDGHGVDHPTDGPTGEAPDPLGDGVA